ncbi:MAG: acyltransferase [Leptolyngbyaceae cyanobacterium]
MDKKTMDLQRTYLENDWYEGVIPGNVVLEKDVYLDTSYSFAAFRSQQNPGLILEAASGVYDRTNLIVGPQGFVTVGAYTCLNGTTLICENRLIIGRHCLLAWGVVITDNWLSPNVSLAARRDLLQTVAFSSDRHLPSISTPQAVTLEDNVWVGFDTVVLPGVTLGRGCIIGCKSVVKENIPPYAIAVGNPLRIVRYLEADDTDEVRQRLLKEYAHA